MKNKSLAILILMLMIPFAPKASAQTAEESLENASSVSQESEEDPSAWEFRTEAVVEKKKIRKPCEWTRECDHMVCWRELRCE